MLRSNVLVICSDEHRRDIAGCYGHSLVKTPNLDRLASRGTAFTNAYAAAPCCVPARASMQTGRWVHQLGTWSSAEPYHGTVPGWGHRLQQAGRRVVSIGKLHFRSSADDNGFCDEIIPAHVVDGVGFLLCAVRDYDAPFAGNDDFARSIGPGESSYTRYDREVCARACEWLRAEAPRQREPWTLFTSFVAPHHPLIAPRPFYDLYAHDAIEMPRLRGPEQRPKHPVLDQLQTVWDYDRHFVDEAHVRMALASYFGLVSFLDRNVGQVLTALEDSGQAENTVVIYTSDHGEMLGNHGLWAKMNMYEESVGIPLIAAGPGFSKGRCDAPASHVDLHPTILSSHGLAASREERRLPGIMLQALARGGHTQRAVISEYHEVGAVTAMIMLRWRHWKYVCYPGYAPQLFDRDTDPQEAHDRAADPDFARPLVACDAKLRQILDPDAVNARALADQRALVASFGGREAALTQRALQGYTPMPV